jgi:co-chaperonin GroES (HSP10)
MDIKVGDTVVYSKYGGTEITVDGEDLLILSARDVLADRRRLSELTSEENNTWQRF